MKVLIAAGGTGGHIYPGIAIANEIVARNAGSEILFVGTSHGIEKRIVPENGYQLVLINSAGLKNVGLSGKLKGLGLLPKSFLEARNVIREFCPDVVVGAGGYVSGPVLMTAHFMGYPTLIMDSNALPGFTNRQLARFVDKAAVSFEAALPYFGSKGELTGNPVRKEFFDIQPREVSTPVHLLIFGGSQGARAINDAMMCGLSYMDELKGSLTITHQTGAADLERVKHGYSMRGWDRIDIREYISDMVEEFDKADLIVCRAGASTCAEALAAGRATLMIPLPGAADDHQRKNAEAMVREKAARMIIQSELTDERFATELRTLIEDPSLIASMGRSAKGMSHPDAAKATVDLLEELCK